MGLFDDFDDFKNTVLKLGIFGVIAWIILPIPDPTDIFITLPLIAYLGEGLYLVLVALTLVGLGLLLARE